MINLSHPRTLRMLVTLCAVDISKAFDRVDVFGLLERFNDSAFSKDFYKC